VSAISPYRSMRDSARRLIEPDFVEIHVAPPLEECIRRDVKGLYAKALSGEIKEFTGISDPYEAPEHPELALVTSTLTVDEGVDRVLHKLQELGLLEPSSSAVSQSSGTSS
jgi:adenylylsulfate kinase